MGAEQIVTVVSVFGCYIWWWVAVSALRKAHIAYASNNQKGDKYGKRANQSRKYVLMFCSDNKDPRRQYLELEGYGKRANNAMNNHQEQFGFFAAAAILNLALRPSMTNGSGQAVAALSAIYAFTRFLHVVCYIGDWDAVRSIAFTFGILALFGLYGLAIAAAV
jgi:uncharacterized MAPEG superfamily protein